VTVSDRVLVSRAYKCSCWRAAPRLRLVWVALLRPALVQACAAELRDEDPEEDLRIEKVR
jgi:hypothetical protein